MLKLLYIFVLSISSFNSFTFNGSNESNVYKEVEKSNISLSDRCYRAVNDNTPYGLTNDVYTSRVTGAEATCYAKIPFTYSTTYWGNTNWRQWYVDFTNGNYSFNTQPGYGYSSDNIKSVSLFESSVITQYNSFTGDSFFIVADATTLSGSYPGFIIRMFAPYNSRINNVEVVFKSATGNVGSGMGFGMGDSAEVQDVSFYSQPIFLLRNEYGISTNTGVADRTAGVKHKFVEFYLQTIWLNLNTTGSVDFDIYLLSSFDNNYNVGYSEGYTSGYNLGYDAGEDSGYDTGYGVGVTDGEAIGYQNGYTAGYNEGALVDSTASTIFTGILDVALIPVNVFLAIFNFEVFGINIAGIVSALLTVSVTIIIVRFLFGGKKDD